MARPRTGSVTRHGSGDAAHFDIQITLPNGTRTAKKCQPPSMTEDEARAKARRLTEAAAAAGGQLLPARESEGPETVERWGNRWWNARRARGMHVDAEIARWRKWVLDTPISKGSTFGALVIADVTRTEIEDLVDHLDRRVRADALSWKTAANAWGLVSKAFSDASGGAKDRALRVRDDNPAKDVRPPDRGQRKTKAWLHPSELLAVLSNADEALEWRRALALNVYLYMRPGELRALRWEDVDLEAGRVRVRRSLRRDGSEKGTKTGRARAVPIEPALLPLLGAMREAAGGVGVVVDLPPDTALADVLRAMLKRAGVTRAELFEGDATRKQITWYDARASGITWRAIRGDNPIAIMHQAGHEDFKTTQGYIREAEAVGASFGTVFPALPAELYETEIATSTAPATTSGGLDCESLAIYSIERKRRSNKWVDRDSNPGPTD